MELRPYQQDTLEKLMLPPHGVNRSLVVMATGAGKTVLFASFLDKFLKKNERALILAHREELLTQAQEKLAHAAPSLYVEIEQAGRKASKTITGWRRNREGIDRTVVVASVQTLRGERLKKWDPSAFSVVIIDEAHHSTATSYNTILQHFGVFNVNSRTRLVGVTATPGRTDGIGLGAVYQEITADYGIRELIHEGWLCPIKARRISSSVSLEGVKTVRGDFAQNELEDRVDVSDRNELIVTAYEQFALGMRTIVFAAGVGHAHRIADIFRARGHSAAPIWGDMPKDKRKELLNDYGAGKVGVLTNYGVLTEGFDSPKTSCIILARPTKSSLVVAQCIGRGTRLADGKSHCLVLDIRDTITGKNLCSASTLAGLPPNFDPKGGDVMKLGEDLENLDPVLRPMALDADLLGAVMQKVKDGLSVAEIDLFSALRVDPVVRERSSLAWRQSGADSWSLRAGDTTYKIHTDTLGRFVFMDGSGIRAVEYSADTAFQYADAWVRHMHHDKMKILDVNQGEGWRKRPASEPQLAFLRKKLKGRELPANLTQGDASLLVDSFKK
jgi:superfamily II DNA or RNA helicase